MMREADIKQISELIIKEITQTATPDEQEMLQDWRRESAEHETLFRRLHQETSWQSGELRFRMLAGRDGWDAIQAKVSRRRRWHRIQWSAASVAAVAVILLSFHFLQHPRISDSGLANIVVPAEIQPGRFGATLHLADGRKISLNEEKETRELKERGLLLEDAVLDYAEMADFPQEQHELIVPVAGEYRLILPDSTRVWINSVSSLRYPTRFTGGTRVVELDGEAYFEVAKQTECPFIVRTREMDIRVTGTAFNVKAYQEEAYAATTLVEGSVMVDHKGHKMQLIPGEQALYVKDKQEMHIRQVDVNQYISWKEGLFEFSDVPLKDIRRQLERWYDVKLEFESPAVGEIRFTGALKKDKSLGFILDVIGQTNAVEYFVRDKTVILKKK